MQRWIVGARPRTLPAAVAPVMVGTGAAVGAGIVWWRAAAALVVALAMQVGANYANDYADGIRGADGPERVGPARLVGSGLATPAETRGAAIIAFGIAAVVGLVLSLAVAPWLLLVGAASIAAGWFYTAGRRPYGYAGLGEVSVFLFFGLVATVGSAYVHGRGVTGVALMAGVAVGLLACALLVANNLRDRERDASVGKVTSAVRLGDRRTRLLYVCLLDGGLVCGSLCVLFRPWAVLILAAGVVAVQPVKIVLAGAQGTDLFGILGATGHVQWVAGVMLGLGLALSG